MRLDHNQCSFKANSLEALEEEEDVPFVVLEGHERKLYNLECFRGPWRKLGFTITHTHTQYCLRTH